ncbi:EVE domain-containing protein [uncultured Umboniibacter sp.]|uniref:EVE domain-containing protein n=1 Tax=uncultured Umboniibacter sp. TaxID=1798917 RepID=UPI00261FF61A|nr:EVE domain-containing protein [uncultured Umboniibacter sp.]
MNYWLVKSEPDDFSLKDLEALGSDGEGWNGVRNYQARNFMRDDMALGDLVLFYHSSCKQVGVVGIAKVVKTAYPDPSQFDPDSKYFDSKATVDTPRWFQVDIAFERALRRVPLSAMKANAKLAGLALIKASRLSVMPVSTEHFAEILKMGEVT